MPVVIALDASSRAQRVAIALAAIGLGAGMLAFTAWWARTGASFNPEAQIYAPLGLVLVALGLRAWLVRERLEIDAHELRHRSGGRVVRRALLAEITRVHVVALGARRFVQIDVASGPAIRLPVSPDADALARTLEARLTRAR